MDNKRRDLPNATTILVLGILSLVFCWCYGFLGLILGIVAVVMASGQRRVYREHPEEYTESSYKDLNSGRACGIIAICISVLVMIGWLLLVIGVVTLAALTNM